MRSEVKRTDFLVGVGRWFVEGEAERDEGGDDEDDQGHILKRLPHQLEEGLGRFRWNHVRPERLRAQIAVVLRSTETCENREQENVRVRLQ